MNKNLTSIERITEIKPHPNADRLDLAKVLGYTCVVQKDQYQAGDTIVYIKTDTILPDDPWAEAFKKYSPNRVKAAKLRDVYSEGIIVSLDSLSNELAGIDLKKVNLGTDVTDALKVTKYVPPIPQDIDAKASVLPYQMPATDEERWENLIREESDKPIPFGDLVDLTLKIDGQSCSIGYHLEDDYFFITGRNQELKPESMNNYTYSMRLHNIETTLKSYCQKHQVSLVLRGEVYGKSIQNSKNNPHSQQNVNIAFFDTYDLNSRRHHRKGSRHYFADACSDMGLPTVPLIEEDTPLTQELIDTYSTVNTLKGELFEGIVVKHSKGSFKIINKYYDSKK